MNPPSTLSRTLAPLAGILWALFIAASVLVAIVWTSGFGSWAAEDPSFKRLLPNKELRESLVLLSRAIDPTWIALGAAVIYLGIARSEGLAFARLSAKLTFVPGFLVSMASAATGWPLGPVYYPENFGWKIANVPFAMTLLWLVIVAGSRETAMRLFSRAGHLAITFGTALLSLLTFANLDPAVWKYRAWWLWYPKLTDGANHAPIQSYVTWFILPLILAWFMRSVRVPTPGEKRPWSPVIVWSVVNSITLLTHIALWIR
jgi:hypothetical protein